MQIQRGTRVTLDSVIYEFPDVGSSSFINLYSGYYEIGQKATLRIESIRSDSIFFVPNPNFSGSLRITKFSPFEYEITFLKTSLAEYSFTAQCRLKNNIQISIDSPFYLDDIQVSPDFYQYFGYISASSNYIVYCDTSNPPSTILPTVSTNKLGKSFNHKGSFIPDSGEYYTLDIAGFSKEPYVGREVTPTYTGTSKRYCGVSNMIRYQPHKMPFPSEKVDLENPSFSKYIDGYIKAISLEVTLIETEQYLYISSSSSSVSVFYYKLSYYDGAPNYNIVDLSSIYQDDALFTIIPSAYDIGKEPLVDKVFVRVWVDNFYPLEPPETNLNCYISSTPHIIGSEPNDPEDPIESPYNCYIKSSNDLIKVNAFLKTETGVVNVFMIPKLN